MRVLFVGAGAVGAVYGYHFNQGGGETIFLVKPKHTQALEAGLALYPSAKGGTRSQPLIWREFKTVTTPAQAASLDIEAIVLCVSSDALYSPWLDELLQTFPDTPVVFLQPGLNDRQYLLGKMKPSNLIDGNIPIVSYHAPLETENVPTPGFAYWVPPFQYLKFQGQPQMEPVVEKLVTHFSRGGLKAKRSDQVREGEWIASIVLFVLVAIIEIENWSFKRTARSPWLQIGAQAMKEAITAVGRLRGYPVSQIALKLIGPQSLRFLLWVSPKVVPFDFETYMKAHFTKVGSQMHEGIRQFLQLAEAPEAGAKNGGKNLQSIARELKLSE